MDFGEDATAFIRSEHLRGLRMLLIGGGAVNFHGGTGHEVRQEPKAAHCLLT